MLLLFLCIFFNCDLLHCGEFEVTGNFLGLKVSLRHYFYFNVSSTDVLLEITPGVHQTDPITPQYSDLTSLCNDTSTHDNLSSIHTEDPGLTTPSKQTETFTNSTYTTSTTVPTPEATPSSSTDVVSPVTTVHPPGSGSDSVTTNTETVITAVNTEATGTMDPSVAEYTKKWLDKITSTKATLKLLVPKRIRVFDYGDSAEEFLLPTKWNQTSTQRKISNRKSKNSTSILRRVVTPPQIPKRRNPQSEAEAFWHDPSRESEESSSEVKTLQRTRRPTVTKQKLKPDLLLGKATKGNDNNTKDDDDDNEFKKISSKSDVSKKIMMMHDILPTTKKQWYSVPTEVQKEVMQTATPTARIQFVRHTMFPLLSTTTSNTQSGNKTKENLGDTYMIVFLIQLTRLVATKEKKAVHDVLKHADDVMRGFFKSKQLQWFPKSLEEFTKNVTKLLKKSEAGEVQKQAANLHLKLRERRQMLSDEVNMIIENADGLYDDDEGKHLWGVLDELVDYPNATLPGYWVCNRLINSFLRPFRRLADTRQRQQLMDSIDKVLKSRFASDESNATTASATLDMYNTRNTRDIASSQGGSNETSASATLDMYNASSTRDFASSQHQDSVFTIEGGCNETSALATLDMYNTSSTRDFASSQHQDSIYTINKTTTPEESSCETTQAPKERKRKHRHRSHMRKREKKRHRRHRPLPDSKILVLRSMASRTSVQASVSVVATSPRTM